MPTADHAAASSLSFSHPAFFVHRQWRHRLAGPVQASLDVLNRCASERSLRLPGGQPIAFVASPPGRLPAVAYERRIAERGEIACRPQSRHDLCNALAWLSFPRTKAARNALHTSSAAVATPNGRDRARDAATLLDESGAIVACADPALLELWEARQWRELFWIRRVDAARALRVGVLGHGLLAKLDAPFRAITARALVVAIDVEADTRDGHELAAALDGAAAAWLAVRGSNFAPADLLPLPVAAVPGWDPENLGERLFEDRRVFRQ